MVITRLCFILSLSYGRGEKERHNKRERKGEKKIRERGTLIVTDRDRQRNVQKQTQEVSE